MPPDKIIAYIGLGTNLGDRARNLDRAIELIAESSKVVARSSYMENPAIEEAGPHDFLNAVIKLETELEPKLLLDSLLEIEHRLDPEREQRGRKLARVIDLDLLIYGDLQISKPDLELPHPRMHEREFVMKPLREIAPEL